MKRFLISLLLLGIVGTSITGCSGLVTTQTDTTEETTEIEIGKYDVENDDCQLTVEGVSAFTLDNRYFLVVDFTYINTTSETIDLQTKDFYLFSDNEVTVPRSYSDFNETMNWLSTRRWNPLDEIMNVNLIYDNTSVQPNRTERGYLIYEYFRPFSALEFMIGNLSVYISPQDITVQTVERPVEPVIEEPEIAIPTTTEETLNPEETVETTEEEVVDEQDTDI